VGRNHRIADWNPEDTAAWEAGNNKIARRNLLCTAAGDHVAFSIWSLWSVMALFMPASIYGFSAGAPPGARPTCAGSAARCRAHQGVMKSSTGAMRQQLLGNAPEISQA
jgi:NNP family nitrate/nitrite transporter-like MFS transporter